MSTRVQSVAPGTRTQRATGTATALDASATSSGTATALDASATSGGTAQQTFALWGGLATVMVTEPDRLPAVRATVDRVVDTVDKACSTYRDDSDLARVNAAPGRPVPTGTTLVEILQAALRAAELTDGLVDPTAGKRLRRGSGSSWPAITVDAARQTVSVPEGAALDLGAVGKAFAADLAASLAADEAGCGVLVALAGDLSVAGPIPQGGWRIRVSHDHRLTPGGELPPGQDITLTRPGGLATSSLAVRTWRSAAGRVITHIVDPRTGVPVRGPWRTVSVAAGSCVDANTAATASIVRGATAARWLEQRALPARLAHIDGWVTTVAGWPPDQQAWPGLKVAG